MANATQSSSNQEYTIILETEDRMTSKILSGTIRTTAAKAVQSFNSYYEAYRCKFDLIPGKNPKLKLMEVLRVPAHKLIADGVPDGCTIAIGRSVSNDMVVIYLDTIPGYCEFMYQLISNESAPDDFIVVLKEYMGKPSDNSVQILSRDFAENLSKVFECSLEKAYDALSLNNVEDVDAPSLDTRGLIAHSTAIAEDIRLIIKESLDTDTQHLAVRVYDSGKTVPIPILGMSMAIGTNKRIADLIVESARKHDTKNGVKCQYTVMKQYTGDNTTLANIAHFLQDRNGLQEIPMLQERPAVTHEASLELGGTYRVYIGINELVK